MKKDIKELIDTRTITLSELAKEIGTTRQTIYNVSQGKINPSLLTVKKICAYFDVDYKDYI